MKPIAYDEAFATADNVLRSVSSSLRIEVPRLHFGRADPEQVAQVLNEASLAVRDAVDTRSGLAGPSKEVEKASLSEDVAHVTTLT